MSHFKKYGVLFSFLFILVLSFVLLPKVSFAEYAPGAFVTTWKTDNPGVSANNQIRITTAGGLPNYNVDWGDGTSNTGVGADITHTYSTPGVYTVSITGDFPQLFFVYNNGAEYLSDNEKLLSVEQWGNIEWVSMRRAFQGAKNLVVNATDTPNTSLVTDMEEVFAGATYFNSDISSWNTSNVISMKYLFKGATSFNNGGQPLTWDTSKVTDMSYMFNEASSFNQDISSWNTSSVTDMNHLFYDATSFNQNIGNWNVSNVTNMSYMLGASYDKEASFNQNINSWNTSKVTNMSNMFRGASFFNQDIGGWDVSNVIDMSYMFYETSFNQDIGNWNVSKVTKMSYMFTSTPFNQNISLWNTSSVSDTDSMFLYASSFNQDIGGWDVSKVVNMFQMFTYATSFNQNIGNWNVSNVMNMGSMFMAATSFNQDIGGWDVSNVTAMASMFYGATSFNQNIGNWNVSNVTIMGDMFYNAKNFNQDLSSWNISKATNISGMLDGVILSIVNYDSLLRGWSLLALQPGLTFNAGNSSYFDPLAITARQSIIDTYGWTIIDAGLGTNNPKLTYTGNFREPYLNNGSVTGQRNINFGNDRTFLTNTFVNKGGVLTLGTHYNITPKINGLTSVMTISSDGETATLTFTGKAKKHTDANSINNLTITFYNSAFATQTTDALNITGKTDSSGELIFKTNTVVPSSAILYATDGAGKNPNPTKLYILDQSNGNILQTIGEMGHNIGGMDFHPTTGVLYGNTSGGDADGGKARSLFAIEKTTGEATWLGTIKDPKGKAIAFADIAFRSDGKMFARANWGEEVDPVLFEIDYSCPSNICIATPVSTIQIGEGGSGGTGFDIDDILYIAEYEQNGLYKIDSYNSEIIYNKAYINKTPDGYATMTAAKFNPTSNELFVTRSNSGSTPSDLVKINVNTGEITSVGGPKEHMIFMTALAFCVQGTTLYHGQTIADEGVATLSGETQQVMITSTTDPVRIVIEDDVTDPKIILTSLISSETKELPQMEIVTSIANVYIPSGSITISDETWDGQMSAPTEATAEIPVTNSQFSKAMEVGSPGIKIIFENAVKIVMSGEAGKKLGYFNGGGEFKQIDNICGENSQSWANTNLATEGDCKIDVGTDLVIWTKHFTKFATYTESSSSSSSSRVIGYMPKKIVVSNNPTSTTTVKTVTIQTPNTYNLGTTSIKLGQRNIFVKDLQKFLNINLKLNLVEDGIFGQKTKTAVISFQKANGLTADGIVGPMTKGKIK